MRTIRKLKGYRPAFEILEDRITPSTFLVNSAADNTTDDGDLTLREAILAANGAPANDDHLTNGGAPDANGDRIEFDLADNTLITLTDELPTITDDVVIDGSAVVDLQVSGNSQFRLFDIDTTSNELVVIRGLVIHSGATTSSPGDNGALVRIADSEQVQVISTLLEGGVAALRGGGIFNGTGSLTIIASTFVGNTANGGNADDGGGGIYNLGGTVTIIDSTFDRNLATTGSGSGGGILHNGGTLDISGGTFVTNDANRAGGGIEIRTTITAVDAVISNVQFRDNSTGASPGNGGGIHVTSPSGSNTSTVDVLGGLFEGNSAAAEGGGLWNDVSTTMTITGTTISNNTANGTNSDQGGGGVFNNGGTLIISNSTINNNEALDGSGSGGGILNDGGSLTILNSKINGNSAIRAGGGIEVTTANSRDSNVLIFNSDIIGNSAGNGPGNGGGVHITDPVGDNVSTFEVIAGNINGNIANQEGGGLWNDAGGTLTITDAIISGNEARAADAGADAQGGGGVFNNGGIVNITRGLINGNSATGDLGTDDGGGGIFNDGGIVIITTNTLMGNTSVEGVGNGGGILTIGEGSSVEVTGGLIMSNSARRAGGAAEVNSSELVLTNVLIDGNFAGINGGAVHVSGAGSVTSNSSTFSNNHATNEGGGLWNSDSPDALITINGSTIHNNSARFGGGLFNDGAAGNFVVSNSTISTNDASEGGGIDTEGGTIDIDNSTIFNNRARLVGGGLNVDAAATVNINNSIVAGNNSNSVGQDINGTVQSNFSLIQDATAILGDNTIIGQDPLLGPLQDNGGNTLTHAPQFGSPVINAGNPDFVGPPNQDQRNFLRVLNERVDIGSVETPSGITVVGADARANPHVRVFDTATGIERFNFLAYAAGFSGGVRVATGDINGDGFADIITGTGAGAGPHVKVFDGVTGTEIRSFFAFTPGFTGGIFVAGGDVDDDGMDDIIVGAGPGAGPHVRVFSGRDNSEVASFFAFNPAFDGGVRVGAGGFGGGPGDDVIVGAGPGAGPHVRVIDGAQLGNQQGTGEIADGALLANFFAFNPGFGGGVFVSAGDVTGDGSDDLLVGAGLGGGPIARVFNGNGFGQVAEIVTGDNINNGVRVAASDTNLDGVADLILGLGDDDDTPVVRFFDALTATELENFLVFPGFQGGIFVSGG